MKRKKRNPKNIDIGYYIVGFMDLLGQQDRLRSLSGLPDKSDEAQMEKFREALKGTYGVVTGMRSVFEDYFKIFSNTKTNLDMLTPEQRTTYKSLNNNPIEIKPFSDSIVIFSPLRTDIAKCPTRGIYSIFTAAAATLLYSLAQGNPIRGGIDIGLGMEIKKGEIYGPSLSRAYTLESKIAGYPRIVVGKELITYLRTTASQTQGDIYSKINAIIASSCLKLLTEDDDGCAIVDFLGEYYFKAIDITKQRESIEKAFQNVIKFSEKYIKEKNTKLAFRYTILRSYMEDRLSKL